MKQDKKQIKNMDNQAAKRSRIKRLPAVLSGIAILMAAVLTVAGFSGNWSRDLTASAGQFEEQPTAAPAVERTGIQQDEEVFATAEPEATPKLEANEEQCVALAINGKTVVHLNSIDDVEWVLAEIKKPYNKASAGGQVLSVEFSEKVETSVVVRTEDIGVFSREEVLLMLKNEKNTNVSDTGEYVVKAGDTLSKIAQSQGTSMDKLVSLNPNLKEKNTVTIGQVLKVASGGTAATGLLHVVVQESINSTETIEYKTETKKDSTLDKGKTKVVQQGKAGKAQVTTRIKYVDGQEVGREVTSRKVTEEAVNKIVAVGTKVTVVATPKPTTGGGSSNTGGSSSSQKLYSWPLSSRRISSYFGMRNGRMHYGLDIPSPTGTPIKAGAAGTVTYSANRGDYGLMVEITHANGYRTRYAHCSQLIAKVGQKVNEGDTIALVGSTGRSDGPHVHFEVWINSTTRVNPLNYLK